VTDGRIRDNEETQMFKGKRPGFPYISGPRFKKFLSYYVPYKWIFLSVLACTLLTAAISLAFPLTARELIKRLQDGGVSNTSVTIIKMSILMLSLVAIHAVTNLYMAYRGHMMGAMMETDMRRELFSHYQDLSFRFYDGQKTGQLMTRLTNDLFTLSEFYHHAPEDILTAIIKFAGSFIILFGINPKLTIIAFLFLPFMALFALFFNGRMNVAMRRSRDRIGDINAQIEDNLSGIRVVKSFANEASEKKKFAGANGRFLQSRRHFYWNETFYFEGMVALTNLMTVTVVVFGAIGITKSSLDAADMLAFLLYIGNLVDPINKVVNITKQFQEGFTGFDRFMEVLEVQPDIQDRPDAVDIDKVRGSLSFRKVSFRYDEREDDVFYNINFDVEEGEFIAIVGSSGVGKTTLCSLIPRFYEASTGQVLLDGIDVTHIKLASLRRNVGIVQQDIYLFSGTIYENILFGKPEAEREEVIEAAKHANAHDFIMGLPNGYDTDIGQNGIKLSGGQKQRLSIARVFLKNPPVLIFDEATSSLDNESEKLVQESLEALAKNRTTLVIAHRLSTIRNAGRIIVLTAQGIAEQGSHDELLALEGVYARLYGMQTIL